MAISADKANVTIEFQWESDDDETLLNVKHHTVNGIPTISIEVVEEPESEESVVEESEWINLPVAFFTEVTKFLTSQKIVSPIPSKPAALKTNVIPQSDGSVAVSIDANSKNKTASSSLPAPKIHRKSDAQGHLEPIELADVAPLESLGDIAEIGNAVVNNPNSKSTGPKLTGSRAKRKKTEPETFGRTVIRGANEETSKALRGLGDENKSVKPNHQT